MAISMARRTMEFLRGRSRDYRVAMMSPAGQRVLTDLMKFCRANETCFDADPRIHAVLEGRREVWLRIQNHLNLSPAELYTIASGGLVYNPQEDNDDVAA